MSAMNGAPWGGSEEFWFRIACWMATNGHTVGCCFFEWPEGKQDKIDALLQAGCRVYPIPNPRLARNALHRLRLRRTGFSKLKDICAQDWPIACISQGGYEDVTHRPFRFLYRYLTKPVLIYHNYDESHRLSKGRIKNLGTWINKAALNMGASARIFEALDKIAGLSVPRQAILTNPITVPYQAQPADWPDKDEEGRYVFVMLAQLVAKRKAQDILIKTLAAPKWKERNWILYLYGDGEDRPSLQNLVRENGMTDKIKLMGRTKNVRGVLEEAHLLLQVTHIDAMPLSVTEAMSMARPCVVSQVGDMPRWITHGETGYVAASVTQTGLDETLEMAWRERDHWERMGLEAHRVFTARYPRPYEEHYAALLMSL